jgi:hypothetical protein
VLPNLSVAVAVTLGPVNWSRLSNRKTPDGSAVALPSQTRPSSSASEKISTSQPGQAVPETDAAPAVVIIGGASAPAGPLGSSMPEPALPWIELRRKVLEWPESAWIPERSHPFLAPVWKRLEFSLRYIGRGRRDGLGHGDLKLAMGVYRKPFHARRWAARAAGGSLRGMRTTGVQ